MQKLYDEDEEIEYWDDWFNFIKKRIRKHKPKPNHSGYVYLLECEGFYKIGRAVNLYRRLSEMQGGNPFEIKIIKSGFFEDSVYIETQLHRACLTRRISNSKNREWFILSNNDLKNVIEILDHKI